MPHRRPGTATQMASFAALWSESYNHVCKSKRTDTIVDLCSALRRPKRGDYDPTPVRGRSVRFRSWRVSGFARRAKREENPV